MIPICLMIIGAIIIIASSVLLFKVLISPFVVKMKSINGQLELNDEGAVKRKRKSDRRFLGALSFFGIVVGGVVFLIGWAIGFNEKGEGFWLNRFISGESIESEKWDRLSKEGNYKSKDGTEHPYYLLIDGNKYEFCGEECDNLEDVKNKLSKIKRENTVIIIDSYAVSSKIKEAEKMLTEMGIQYEMEEV